MIIPLNFFKLFAKSFPRSKIDPEMFHIILTQFKPKGTGFIELIMDPVKQQAFIDDFMSEFYETVEMTPTEKDSFISSLRDFYVKHLVIIVEAPAAVAVSTGVTTPAVSTTGVVAGSGTVPSAVAGGTGKKRG